MSIDKPKRIIDSFPSPLFSAKAKDFYKLLKDFRSDKAVASCYAFGEYLHLTLNERDTEDSALQELANKYQPEDFEVKRILPTIEDVFIHLMSENVTTAETNGKGN